MRLKYLLFLLIATCWCSISYSQKRNTYLVYHTYINAAEVYLTEEKVDSCLAYYDRAFREFDYAFVKDAYIAAQVAYKASDWTRVKQYLAKGARYGLTVDCLDQSPLLINVKALYSYKGIADTMLACNKLFRRNDSLAAEWKERFENEQRTKNISFDEYKQVVLANVARLKKLMRTTGYPGERTLGITNNCKELGNYHAFYSLAHYDYAATEFFDDLWKAVKQGNLHPRDFAALCEFESLRIRSVPPLNKIFNPSFKKTPKQLSFNHTWFRDKSEATMTQAAANRAKYYLCSEETDKKKKSLESAEAYRFTFNYK